VKPTAEQRRQIARKAAQARWEKSRKRVQGYPPKKVDQSARQSGVIHQNPHFPPNYSAVGT
jgi:hypothetical protein